MTKKLSESSQQERLTKTSGEDIYKLTPEMLNELEKLAAMPDDKIDLNDPDAPEITDWGNAVRGKFYRPIKKLISIRIDMDVLDWFKHAGNKYQKLINQACREYMEKNRKA